MEKKYALVLLLGFILLGCENKKDIDPVVEQLSSIRGYKDVYLGAFRCGVFVPPSYNGKNKYPLIVYLHGHTDTTTWNLEWYNEPIVSTDPCIVLTPKCPREEIYGWGDSFYPQISPMMQKAYEMMDLAKTAFNLDADRYYIYGTSMGGIGTYGAIQKNPGLFTAAYVKCGAGNSEMADMLVDFPLWIFHGSEDEAIDVQWARDMYIAIKSLGGEQVKYTEYEGVGHNVWDYPRNEVFWLLAQRKGSIHGKPDDVNGFSYLKNEKSQISLSWYPPSDLTDTDNQMWFYNVYRNDEVIKEVDSPLTNYTDSTALTGITYTYKVSAVNFFFKVSDFSSSISVEIGN